MLLKLNGKDVVDVPSLSADIIRMAGQQITFDILRGEQPRKITLTLNP